MLSTVYGNIDPGATERFRQGRGLKSPMASGFICGPNFGQQIVTLGRVATSATACRGNYGFGIPISIVVKR